MRINKVVGAFFLFIGCQCVPLFGVVEVVSALIEMARHYSSRPPETYTREPRSRSFERKEVNPGIRDEYGQTMLLLISF